MGEPTNRRLWISFVTFLISELSSCSGVPQKFDDIRKFNEDESRSRLVVIDGNMYFHAGKGKNITFLAGVGGSIFYGGKDLNLLPELTEFQALKDDFGAAKVIVDRVSTSHDSIKTLIRLKSSDIAALNRKITNLTRRIDLLNTTRRGAASGRRNLVNALRAQLRVLETKIKKDDCIDGPCKNGGTCIDLFDKFLCLCPKMFEGPTCESNVDECEMFAGTAIGCQNGGTCINDNPGIRCLCTKDWHGARCQTKKTSCDQVADLCGEAGHCMPQADGYRCLCEWGYQVTNDANNPTCVDINECLSNPCYPGASCINLPGSFRCSGCPAGMTGNGMNCADIDECADPNVVTCSKDPPVACINTIGSFSCLPCPPGYDGDGRVCKKQDPCQSAPCYPSAKCYRMGADTMNKDGFRCECPVGMVGDGIGNEGCKHSNATVCKANTCYNQGTCQATSDTTYKCHCRWGFVGERCESPTACLSNVCGGRGECIPLPDASYECKCKPGYYGKKCELQEDGCGGHITNSTGVIDYPSWEWSYFGRNKSCEWIIAPYGYVQNKVLELNFTRFSFRSLNSDCASADGVLTLRDGEHSASPIVGTYCGRSGSFSAPPGIPVIFSSSKAYISFVSNEKREGIGGFTAEFRLIDRKCGGREYRENGQISLYDYDKFESCQWHISVNPGNQIEATVDPIRLASNDIRNCTLNSLELFDGLLLNRATRILHLCSSETTKTVVRTTLPYLSIYFKSNFLEEFEKIDCKGDPLCKRGFTITYRAIPLEDGCGGHLLPDAAGAFTGIIQSPNYGFGYFPNLNCVWVLDASTSTNVAQDAHVVRVEILDFDVHSEAVSRFSSPELAYLSAHSRFGGMLFRVPTAFCRGDHLTFRDGENNLAQSLGRFCNSNRPKAAIVSTGPKMFIQFHSDRTLNGKGFKIRYEAVCEKHFTAANGTIQSSNYPNGTDRKFRCTYVIDAKKLHAIRLKFTFIGLRLDPAKCFADESKQATIEDYVELSGGHASHEQVNKRYLCPRFPFLSPDGEITVSGGKPLTITYSSTNKENKGILFEYEQIDVGCGGTFAQESGTITSPGFPEKYMPHMYCVYIISVPAGRVVQLTFDVFDLETMPRGDACSYDSIEIYDTYESETKHGKMHGRFCGALTPPTMFSTANELTVVFKSDRSLSGAGFSAHWQSVKAKDNCHRTYTAKSGDIVIKVENNQKFAICDIHIALPTSSRILLHFVNFTAPCAEATLTVRNGVNENAPGFSGLFGESEVCDDHPAPDLRSQGNRIFLRLKASNPRNAVFFIHYEQIESGCGGRMSGMSGALSAPQYPLKDSRSLECDWHIVAAHGNRISFSLIKLDDLSSGDFHGYCSAYAPNRLDIAEGPHATSKIIRRYCEKETTFTPVITDSNELSVKYKQKGGIHFNAVFGFLAHYSTVCNGITLTGHYGVLESPGYPHRVLEDRKCRWRIQTTRGSRLRLIVHLFRISGDVYGPPSCFNNYLAFEESQLLNVTSNVKSIAGRFCDRTGPPLTILTKREFIDISFQSHEQPENHFSLSWSSIGCGGLITTDKEEIKVQMDSLVDSTDLFECEWAITAPLGLRVLFSLKKFAIFEQGTNCSGSPNDDGFSGLAFYSGKNNETGVVQGTRCKKVEESERSDYKSHSSSLFVKLKIMKKHITAEKNRTFFEASIHFVQPSASDQSSSCGAIINVTAGSPIEISSPGFPTQYIRGVECTWLVNAPPGRTLQFNVTHFTTPGARFRELRQPVLRPLFDGPAYCQGGVRYVEGLLSFRDGNSTSDEVIEQFCRSMNTSKVFTSLSDQVLIVFESATYENAPLSGDDERKYKIGFSLTISLRCGGTLYATPMLQSIRLDLFQEDECIFVIKSVDEAGRVYLRMDHIKFRPLKGITQVRGEEPSKVTVRDGKSADDTILGEFHYSCSPNQKSDAILNKEKWCYAQELRSSGNVLTVNLTELNKKHIEYIFFSYSSQTKACGGELHGIEGTVFLNPIPENVQCEWTVSNTDGNLAEISVKEVSLPDSPHCSDSYLEVRQSNSSGPIAFHVCGTEVESAVARGQSLWMMLRYVREAGDEPLVESGSSSLLVHFSKSFGGTVGTNHVISSPTEDDWRLIDYRPVQWEIIARADHWIKISISKIEIPPELDENADAVSRTSRSGLIFNEGLCPIDAEEVDSCGAIVAIHDGYTPKEDFWIKSQTGTVLFRAPRGSSFSLRWDDVPKAVANGLLVQGDKTDVGSETEFSCGGTLAAAYEPQFLTNPGGTSAAGTFTTVMPITSTERWNRSPFRRIPFRSSQPGYADNLKCRWTITKPPFTGLSIKIISMDLEEHPDCRFDYVAFVGGYSGSGYRNGQVADYVKKYCKHSDVGEEQTYQYDDLVSVYFITDRNRAGRGFVLEYKLTCTSTQYIPLTDGILDHIIQSPGYPRNYDNNLSCKWVIMTQSNRDIVAEFTDMDIESSSNCENDYVIFNSRNTDGAEKKICGKQIGYNITAKGGRIEFSFVTDDATTGKGFALHLYEVLHDCSSSRLMLQEGDSPKTLSSPEFPHLSPNSLDCQWTISAPSGHRIKFTVDPTNFDLEDSSSDGTCEDDYLEIHDGPSVYSPSLGRFCKEEPPSTIFSTGSYLFVKYITDSYVRSRGWTAKYEIASCGGSLVLPVNLTTPLTSPNFPHPYPSKANCTWLVMAPHGHYINASFNHLWTPSRNCSTVGITMRDGANATGDYILKPTCTSNDVMGQHYTSTRNFMVVNFYSNLSTPLEQPFCEAFKCGFDISLRPSSIECGGTITDSNGVITSPGYPGEIPHGIACDWVFKAGIGFRYIFKFTTFADESYSTLFPHGCYPDVSIYNGHENNAVFFNPNQLLFCVNKTQFISSTDLVSLSYDNRNRLHMKKELILTGKATNDDIYQHFLITYEKVPENFDGNSCMYHIVSNGQVQLVPKQEDAYSINFYRSDFCHILIERPTMTGTTILRFSNFSTSLVGSGIYRHFGDCQAFDNRLKVSALSNDPIPYENLLCNASVKNKDNFTLALVHQKIDIYVIHRLPFGSIKFNLTVEFADCGGTMRQPHRGTIKSPGFDEDGYGPNVQCRWILEAPEGHIVKLEFNRMNIESQVECKHDYLKLFEGIGADASLIHIYCNDEGDNPLKERFRIVKSKGRYMMLYFVTDFSVSAKGFKATYDFLPSASECGFSTKAESGHIVSPGYPDSYKPNLHCVWDISVPQGYHVAVRFNRLNIQKTENCSSDYLKISQEHQSRAMAPIGDYYFLYNFEDDAKIYCGFETPSAFESESNRIRIVFVSDAEKSGAGFNITWESKCQTTFRLSHGVVTSPYYPYYYPNKDMVCEYLIDPETKGTPVVVLKLLDYQLSGFPSQGIQARRLGCDGDSVQIFDVNANRVVMTACASSDDGESPPISVKGPVKILFKTNYSVFEETSNVGKHYRGFKLSYVLSKCGGDVNLSINEGRSTVITSPGFPLPYHHNLECVWNISTEEGRIISVKYKDLEIEYTPDCRFDYVEIFDGFEMTNETSLGRRCGDRVPYNQILSSSRQIFIKFVSDRSMSKGGFKVFVTSTLGPGSGCGGDISLTNDEDTKMLRPPMENGTYHNNLRCGWSIKSMSGRNIEFKIKEFELEPPNLRSQCYDFLAIYDGYKIQSPLLLSNTCSIAETLPVTLTTSRDRAYVYFESDSNKAYRGFLIEYRQVRATCGETRSVENEEADLQYETEKGLTRDSPKHRRCRWILYSKEKLPLEIHFSDFSFPSTTSDCVDEYMEIRDAGTPADCSHPACADALRIPQTIRLCGYKVPANFISATSIVQITTSAILKSDHTSKFKLKYRTLGSCNRSVALDVKKSGRITSPNYPNKYDHNCSCTTTLEALDSERIFIVFRDFQLERGRRSWAYRFPSQMRPLGPVSCDYDYVQIFDGNGNSTGRYCEMKLPPSYLSESNKVRVFFETDSSMALMGYDAYYWTVKPTMLQGTESVPITFYDFPIINEMQGAITNIGYPGYGKLQRMRWQIATPNGNRCQLKLVSMSFGTNVDGSCTEGDRMLYGNLDAGSTEGSDLEFLPCRNATTYPHVIPMEPSKTAVLEFYADGSTSDDGDGFRIEWECEPYFVPQV